MNAIEVSHLSKSYSDGKNALQDVNLTIRRGEIFTLLGQNGAGKSTLVNILTTYLKASGGTARILGLDLTHNAGEIRKHIACVAQRISIDRHLSLFENLLFQCRLYGLKKNEASARIKELVSAFGLEEYSGRRVATYSGGVQRRLDLAMSMVSRPDILFLDEPCVGLDVEARQAVWNIIRSIRDDFGATILMTTHDLQEAGTLSDTLCILKEGHVLIQDTLPNLRSIIQQTRIQIGLNNTQDVHAVKGYLSACSMVEDLHLENHTFTIRVLEPERDLLAITASLLEKHIPFHSIGLVEPDLENVYLSFVGKQKGN